MDSKLEYSRDWLVATTKPLKIRGKDRNGGEPLAKLNFKKNIKVKETISKIYN